MPLTVRTVSGIVARLLVSEDGQNVGTMVLLVFQRTGNELSRLGQCHRWAFF